MHPYFLPQVSRLFHGGAYNHGSGSSPWYDGRALARHGDVVVVTVNHRLNAFVLIGIDGADAVDLNKGVEIILAGQFLEVH